MAGDQGTLGLYTPRTSDGRWPRSRQPARRELAKLAAEHTADWQGLGVSILHRLLVENLLGGKDWPKPRYVHLVDEVIEQSGNGASSLWRVLVMPATVDHIRSISEHGERMPAKSTYFYPKLLSGMVINPLE